MRCEGISPYHPRFHWGGYIPCGDKERFWFHPEKFSLCRAASTLPDIW